MAEQSDGLRPVPLEAFEPGEACRWQYTLGNALRRNAHYIASPAPGQDRSQWLAALRDYRRQVRAGEWPFTILVDFQGTRAWIRSALPLAKACDFRPGETVTVEAEARWLSGAHELAVAFDYLDRVTDTWVGWSSVVATLSVPPDGQWQRVRTRVTIPSLDSTRRWPRLILGRDATHDAAPGQMEIRHIGLTLPDPARARAVDKAIQQCAGLSGELDRRIYDRPEYAWASRAGTCHFTFTYDRSFYDPRTGQYSVEAVLDDGLTAFGGYDILVLWQGYPRLGVDPRNQFDMYRDMPGGLTGLRDVVQRTHARSVRVFVDYNPWDQGTRREDRSDEEALADLVDKIGADGIFLDTMTGGSVALRDRLDRIRPGIVLAPEGHPEIEQLGLLSMSWAQGLHDENPPGLLHLKWIEPRHMQHQIRRWDADHRAEIETAFFNGSGILIWENVFGFHNPWQEPNRRAWRRASAILRHFADCLTSDRWDPFYPTKAEHLFAHAWPGDGYTLFTLLNWGELLSNTCLLEIPPESGEEFYDLWKGERLVAEPHGDVVRLIGSIDRIGCLLAIRKGRDDPSLQRLLEQQRREATPVATQSAPSDPRREGRPVIEPELVDRTQCVSPARRPPGMVLVPHAHLRIRIEHMRRECGCYPDPGTPPERWGDFLRGWPHDQILVHDYGPIEIRSFLIDEAQVSNAEFKRFVDDAGYRPRHPENFLKHWPAGRMSAGLAEHPVVYVDIDDARAYARWAGKRLPTEEEWQLAAQGTDGRKWPWGNDFDPSRCNMTGAHTLPVRSYPTGRSPYGCYHMSGNVWEWTESCRDDGHTRFVMIRGGSYYHAQGSIWYVRGGPQPCNHHAKFVRMWPGLDRCATIGFRCVVDVEE